MTTCGRSQSPPDRVRVGPLSHLRLFALEAHDLALTKLARNSDRDRADVEFLATAAPLNPSLLRERYTREMRPYLDRPDREDLDPLRANGSRCDWALVSVMIPHERRLSAPSQRLQRSLGDAEPVSFAVPDT
jgi:hypothetical protein